MFSNGKLEFECYIVRFDSNILEFYFLLVYFSSCVVRLILKFNHEYIFFYSEFWAHCCHFVKKKFKTKCFVKKSFF